MKQKIAKANEKRKRLEAASQNLEHQKKFVLDLLHDKLQSCSIQEQQQTREALEKMIAGDEKSKVGFQIDARSVWKSVCLIRADRHLSRVNFKGLFKNEFDRLYGPISDDSATDKLLPDELD